MPRSCTSCRHPERASVDADIVAHVPTRHIATRYNLTPTSVQRHKEHVQGMIAEARHAAALDVVAELRAVYDEIVTIQEGETKGVRKLAAIDRRLKVLELLKPKDLKSDTPLEDLEAIERRKVELMTQLREQIRSEAVQ